MFIKYPRVMLACAALLISNQTLATNLADICDNNGCVIDFESGTLDTNLFSFSGNANWMLTDDTAAEGSFSLQAPASLIDSQSAAAILVIESTVSHQISFSRRVSSESSYDYLVFSIDGNSTDRWSGSLGWENFNYALEPGEHTFKWEYSKDSSVSSGQDVAWIDHISFIIDTDSDGLPDLFELENDLDPNDPLDATLDADNDGLDNLAEFLLGTLPNQADTDGDSLSDGEEVANTTDPLQKDTDADGSIDGFDSKPLSRPILKLDSATKPQIAVFGLDSLNRQPELRIYTNNNYAYRQSISRKITWPNTFKNEQLSVHLLPDTDGNGAQDVGVFGISDSEATDGLPQFIVKDSLTSDTLNTYSWSENLLNNRLMVLSDLNQDGISEIGLQGIRSSDNSPQLIVKDGASTETLYTFSMPDGLNDPEYTQLHDMNGDGIPEIGLIGKLRSTYQLQVKVIDGSDPDSFLTAYNFVDRWDNPEWVALTDTTGDGVAEWGLLGKNKLDGRTQLVVKNGTTISGVEAIFSWPAELADTQLLFIPDINDDGVDEFALGGKDTRVMGGRDDRYRVIVKSGADRNIILKNDRWGTFFGEGNFAIVETQYNDINFGSLNLPSIGLIGNFNSLFKNIISNTSSNLSFYGTANIPEVISEGNGSNFFYFVGIDQTGTEQVQKSSVDFYNPLNGDADRDGIPDLVEIEQGLNPVNFADALLDKDNDGLDNITEYQIGTLINNPDTDGDGLSDELEVNTYSTNPTLSDTDADGLSDSLEVNQYATDPLKNDSDEDGVYDNQEIALGTNPNASDSDTDGIDDKYEIEFGLLPNNPSDANLDLDLDGLTNLQEFALGTNPSKSDTDTDGSMDNFDQQPLSRPVLSLSALEVNGSTQISVFGLNATNQQPELRIYTNDYPVEKLELGRTISWSDTFKNEQLTVHLLADNDGNGAQNVGVFGIGLNENAEHAPRFVVKDSYSGNTLNTYNWPADWHNFKLLILDDLNGDGVSEVALQGILNSDNSVQLMVKDGITAEDIYTFSVADGLAEPEYTQLHDMNGDGIPEIGLIGKLRSTYQLQVKVIDGSDPSNLLTAYNFTNRWDNPQWIALNDTTGDGIPEWGMLGKNKLDGRTQLVIKNGTNISGVEAIYSWTAVLDDTKLMILTDVNGDGVDEYGLAGKSTDVDNVYRLIVKSGADTDQVITRRKWTVNNNDNYIDLVFINDMTPQSVGLIGTTESQFGALFSNSVSQFYHSDFRHIPTVVSQENGSGLFYTVGIDATNMDVVTLKQIEY
jgi:hypothetical protein